MRHRTMNIKNLNPIKLLSALIGCLNRLVRWPFMVLDELEKLNKNMERIANASDEVKRCIYNDNHRRRHAFRTGHWND